MAMTLVDLHAFPSFIPIPQFYGHIIRSCKNKGLCWMNNYGSDIVRMSFEGGDFLRGVVIVYADLEIIRTANDPVFAGDESASSHGNVGEFKSLDNSLTSA